MNWSFLIIAFAISLGLMWLSHYFFGKNGLMFFVVGGGILGNALTTVTLFDYPVTIGSTIFACMFFAIMYTYFNYGRDDACKMVILGTVSSATLFVFNFFQALYTNSELVNTLTWANLGSGFMSFVAFGIGAFLTILIADKLGEKIKNQYLKYFSLVLISIVLDVIVFSTFAHIGVLSFAEIMAIVGVSLLVKFVATCITSAMSYVMKEKE